MGETRGKEEKRGVCAQWILFLHSCVLMRSPWDAAGACNYSSTQIWEDTLTLKQNQSSPWGEVLGENGCLLSALLSALNTHTRTQTQTQTQTHTFLWKVGTFHRRNGFYTVQTVCAIALHLTENCVFLPSQKKLWLQHILKSGDKGQCPRKSPSHCHTGVIIQIYVLVCHINERTHTLTTRRNTFKYKVGLWVLQTHWTPPTQTQP